MALRRQQLRQQHDGVGQGIWGTVGAAPLDGVKPGRGSWLFSSAGNQVALF